MESYGEITKVGWIATQYIDFVLSWQNMHQNRSFAVSLGNFYLLPLD